MILKISQRLDIHTESHNLPYLTLFTVFILHSRESELYRYVFDGMSALAWELLFPRCLGHLSFT